MSELIFEKSCPGRTGYTLPQNDIDIPLSDCIDKKFLRKAEPRLPEVSELDVMRHFIELSNKNHFIEKGFYPLGSCTMKYNPKFHEAIVRLSKFCDIHPEQPSDTTQGTLHIMHELQKDLSEIAGMAATTLHPAAGAHGEFTGLKIIQAYHKAKGNSHKNVIIFPDSAHGTNPATVTLAGMKSVEIKSNEFGMVDLQELKKAVNENTAGFMLTNPNTLGMFETQIQEIAQIIHSVDGLMYMDGANFNALLGIVKPGHSGFDVLHYNIHKTLASPHGGGGPGSGPVSVREDLIQFLPHPMVALCDDIYYLDSDHIDTSIGRVHSYYGNFATYLKAYVYIKTIGATGLCDVAQHAIINANYLQKRLHDTYLIPHAHRWCMHEFVASGDRQKEKSQGKIKTLDIAKRLLDKGFHAPTIYFPLIISEAIMIEPTETESKQTLDKFVDAMIEIDRECIENPEIVINAPSTTPVKRVDDVKAVKELNVRYQFTTL
jgi:glycine dehydrogenase subunit 2